MSYKIILNDAIKKNTYDQDKLIPPSETLKKVTEKLKNINIDILETTNRIDNGRLDIPVFFSICGEDARKLTTTKKQMGKGATPVQSETSAVMELVERFSLFSFKSDESKFFTDSYNNIEKNKIDFKLIAESVHDNSDELSITKEFFGDLPLKWTWGYNLTTKEEVLVPFDWFFTINEFNGSSAGNCNEEALCQGISEVIERHVSSIVSGNRLEMPLIDHEGFNDENVKIMFEKYRKNGIQLYISDMSLDTGIATVSALAWDPATFPAESEIVWTAGTAPDPEKAVSRALTEVAQLAGDFNTNSNYVASGLPKYHNLKDIEYITNAKKTIKIENLPNNSDINIKIELENYISVLKKRGMEVIVLNATHKDLNVPAFYTIIPGTHFRERAKGTSVGMFTAKLITEKYSTQSAIKILKEMDEKLPGKYYIHFYLGTIYLEINDYQNALKHLRKALTLNPERQDIPSVYSYIGLCLKDLGKYEESIEVLEKGLALDNEREDILNLLGFCHFKLKNNQKAIDYFKEITILNPASAINYANIASNYRDMNEKTKAVAYYKMAVELDPDLDFAIENLKKLS